jgi:putative transposase
MPEGRRFYPTDLSDAEWALLAPLLEKPGNRGRPPKWPRRLIADATFYLLRSGCAWRLLPREYPPWQTVCSQFRRWRLAGTLRAAHDRLRERVRLAEGRDPEPSAAILDSQTARTTGVGGPARGYDGAERAKGRKRHLLVDTLGPVLLAGVHAADVPDRAGARLLLDGAGQDALPRLGLVWADAAYAGAFADRLAAERGWRLEVPRHPDRQLWRHGLEEKPKKAFRVLPRRWIVERTFAWLGQARRLSKDHEHLPHTGETMIHAAMARIMLRRLSRSTG